MIRSIRENRLDELRQSLAGVPGDSLRSPRGRTLLHAAAEEGRAEAASLLLDAGCDVNARTDDAETPLHFAARYGRGIDLLLSDPDFNDVEWPQTRKTASPTHPEVIQAFMVALRKRMPELPPGLGATDAVPPELKWQSFCGIAELLCDRQGLLKEMEDAGLDVARLDPEFWQLLKGYPRYLEVASLLLDCGAEVNARDETGRTPLLHAVEMGELAMVELLLKRGARTDLMSGDENFPEGPMDAAINYNQPDKARLLYACGARPNFNLYPLHRAAGSGQLPLLQWLVEMGGDINQTDEGGNSPLLCGAGGHEEVVRWLCERGANVELRNVEGETALHQAAHWPSCVRLLLARGLGVNLPGPHGRTPLHIAAMGASEDAIAELVSAGASTDLPDDDGNTPLHCIFEGEELRPDIEYSSFEALVKAGANRSARNREGKTAFDLAREFRYPPEYLELLDPERELPGRPPIA